MSAAQGNGRQRQRLMQVTLWFAAGPAKPKLREITERWDCSETTAIRWRSDWLAVRAALNAEARHGHP